jgi:NAD(P)H-nitrite reductase large subunit
MTTHHVIIGGGPVATNAAETIRQFESEASRITLVCDEPAHSRMALPYWLAGKVPREQTHTADAASFEKLGVDAKIGVRVNSIDPQAKSLSLSDDGTLEFDNLLIGTGSRPLELPIPGADLPGVQPLWSLGHTQSLLDATADMDKPRVVMIGAGFIGFIMLNAMHKRGWDLAVVERESHVLPRMLDDDAATLVESWLADKGVAVHTAAAVQAIREGDDGSKVVELDNGTQVTADIVVVATGVQPNLELLDGSGITTDAGILVDDHLRTNFPFIYAGGDCTQGPAMYADGPEIHAIQTTAVDHGRVAGANMADGDVAYSGSLLMNILDVCGLQNASFGNWSDENAEAITISNARGYVYRKLLFTGDQLTGALFVGRANDMGMLTDVGMVKGIMQTETALGSWKEFLRENPFDIRRPYIAKGVAGKLKNTTLLGRPAQPRGYRFGGAEPKSAAGPGHAVYVGSK